MDAIDFLRLCDCAQSTRLGMADRGFPRAMGRLEAKGYVARATEASEAKQKWPGYKVTTLGLAVIREHLRDSRPKSTARDTFIEDEVRGERTL